MPCCVVFCYGLVTHNFHYYFIGTGPSQKYSAVLLWRSQSYPKSSHQTLHSLPVRVRYGVSFVNTNSGLCFTSVTSFTFTISYYMGLHYNNTWLLLSWASHKSLISQEIWIKHLSFRLIHYKIDLHENIGIHNAEFGICKQSNWFRMMGMAMIGMEITMISSALYKKSSFA